MMKLYRDNNKTLRDCERNAGNGLGVQDQGDRYISCYTKKKQKNPNCCQLLVHRVKEIRAIFLRLDCELP